MKHFDYNNIEDIIESLFKDNTLQHTLLDEKTDPTQRDTLGKLFAINTALAILMEAFREDQNKLTFSTEQLQRILKTPEIKEAIHAALEKLHDFSLDLQKTNLCPEKKLQADTSIGIENILFLITPQTIEINLQNNHIKPEDLEYLLQFMRENKSNLKIHNIDLSFNQIGDKGFINLITSLLETSISHCTVRKNNITFEQITMSALLPIVSVETNPVKSMCLAQNNIANIEQFCSYVAVSNLDTLNFSIMSLSPSEILNSLASSTLKNLILNGSFINSTKFKGSLFSFIEKITTLEKIQFVSSEYDEKLILDFKDIEKIKKLNPKLTLMINDKVVITPEEKPNNQDKISAITKNNKEDRLDKIITVLQQKKRAIIDAHKKSQSPLLQKQRTTRSNSIVFLNKQSIPLGKTFTLKKTTEGLSSMSPPEKVKFTPLHLKSSSPLPDEIPSIEDETETENSIGTEDKTSTLGSSSSSITSSPKLFSAWATAHKQKILEKKQQEIQMQETKKETPKK